MKGTTNCLECGKTISGRSDKKFCGEICRSSYNNRIRYSRYKHIDKINQILKKNYMILKDLYCKNIVECSCSMLMAKGFNFDYFTSIDQGTDILRIICYNYSYYIDNNGAVFIKKEEE